MTVVLLTGTGASQPSYSLVFIASFKQHKFREVSGAKGNGGAGVALEGSWKKVSH